MFVSKSLKRLCKLLQIQPSSTTTFHPQTNEQTERVNQVLEQFIWTKHQDDWVDLLPLAKFAYNNASHAAT